VRGQQLLGCRETLPEEPLEAGEDALCGPAVELLMRDGAPERFIGRAVLDGDEPAEGGDASRSNRADQSGHDRIGAQQAMRDVVILHGGWHFMAAGTAGRSSSSVVPV